MRRRTEASFREGGVRTACNLSLDPPLSSSLEFYSNQQLSRNLKLTKLYALLFALALAGLTRQNDV